MPHRKGLDDELLGSMGYKENKRSQKFRKTNQAQTNFKLDVKSIKAKTPNQQKVIDAFNADKNLLLHGAAGTGKTFLALYLALNAVIRGSISKPVVILRSVVPGRDMGFLPGKMEEKIAVYEEPYFSLCEELTGHKTAYEFMKKNEFVEFSTTSYLRGITFHDNIIIVDECQNMSFQELDTIMTRVGDGCRIIFCGDFRQTDLSDREKSGFSKFIAILKEMKSFEAIEFTNDDIQRSGVVREYLMTKERNLDL